MAISPGLFRVAVRAGVWRPGTGLPAPRNPRALIRSIQRERHKAAKAHDDDDDDD